MKATFIKGPVSGSGDESILAFENCMRVRPLTQSEKAYYITHKEQDVNGYCAIEIIGAVWYPEEVEDVNAFFRYGTSIFTDPYVYEDGKFRSLLSDIDKLIVKNGDSVDEDSEQYDIRNIVD